MPRLKSTHIDSPAACGARLKEARLGAGLSQRGLAFTGCTAAYISRIEAGERIPSLQLLRELGRLLGVTADWLATGAEEANVVEEQLLEAEVALRLGDVDTARRLFDEALKRGGATWDQAEALAGLGQIDFLGGDPRNAIERLENALTLYGDGALRRPAVADTLGRAYARVGELESAISVFRRFLDAAMAAGDVVERMRFSVLLANAYIDGGNFGPAEELLGRELSLSDEWNDPLFRARLYWSQSRLHMEKGDSQTAARYARKALHILEITEHTHYTARAHQLLAHIELDRGNAETALDVLGRGAKLINRSGNPLERAEYCLEEARALAALGRTQEAARLAMQISGLISEANPEDSGRAYALLGEVYEQLGEPARAREIYELAADILERAPNRYLIDVYGRLAALLEADGRVDEALAVLKRAMGVRTRSSIYT